MITLFELALCRLPGIGNVLGRQLVSYCGNAEQVFKTKKSALLKIPGIGEQLADAIIQQNVLKDAENELQRALKDKTNLLYFNHPSYPKALFHLPEAPMLLYAKGNADFNAPKMISIVGTRAATGYGEDVINHLLESIQSFGPTIVSGLAYGIDILAHKKAIALGLPTIAVMGNGMDAIYPAVHKKYTPQMIENGALLTEYGYGKKAEAFHFPARNRIIAGLSQLTLVVEAQSKGGALITAEIANEYNREVMAVPGRVEDKCSQGCNMLIKQHKAHIYTKPQDVVELLQWDVATKKSNPQPMLPLDLSEMELKIFDLLQKHQEMHIDDLSFHTVIPINTLASTLLELEFKGYIKNIPGKKFKWVQK